MPHDPAARRFRTLLTAFAVLASTALSLAAPARARNDDSPATVPAVQGEQYGGYLFAYFTGEGSPDGEQVYFAASRGNNPLAWDEPNGDRPVLTPTLGERGVRDQGTEDWYIVYHRFGVPGGDGTHRETTIDAVSFGRDGLMKSGTPTLETVRPQRIPRQL